MAKIIDFQRHDDDGEEEIDYVEAFFPDLPTIQAMLCGKNLAKVLIVTVNTDGDVSHYTDGCTALEAMGLLEMLKFNIHYASVDYGEEG